jgi:hypothetical protein
MFRCRRAVFFEMYGFSERWIWCCELGAREHYAVARPSSTRGVAAVANHALVRTNNLLGA